MLQGLYLSCGLVSHPFIIQCFFQCTGPFSLLACSFQVETQMLSDEIFLIKYSYSYLSLAFGDYTTAIVFVKKKKSLK